MLLCYSAIVLQGPYSREMAKRRRTQPSASSATGKARGPVMRAPTIVHTSVYLPQVMHNA
jgi:hypothetical protein